VAKSSKTGLSRSRGLIIGLIAVVVFVLAVAAYFAFRPSAADENATNSDTPTVATSTSGAVADLPVAAKPLSITPLSATAPTPSPAGVQAALAGPLANPALAQFSGFVLDPATSTVLFDQNSDALQLPASTMKLLTGAAVLTTLDPQSRLTTKVVQGDEPGTIVFVGGGDPTLSARPTGTETVYDGAPLVTDLAEQVLASGTKVTKIVLDISRWTGPRMADGWLTSDISAGFITPMSPLVVDGDRVNPAARNSQRTGDPEMTAGKALALALGVPNVEIVRDGQASPDAAVLGEVHSQPIAVLLSQALANSDNVLAESLAREVAIAMGGAGSFSGVQATLQIVLEDLGFDSGGLTIADASGMSNLNEVPTKLLAEILGAAVTADGPLRDLVIGLPVAGANGTLVDRFLTPESAGARGWIRAKTGSLDVTYALAGIVLDQDGRLLVFSFISNGVSPETRPAQDALAAALRSCGCA
jgi:D-alanyl-D-alanine carboxypeptidase/D-alanyl-D-alanine-endopeptidase (penicillin-binding protein 4)